MKEMGKGPPGAGEIRIDPKTQFSKKLARWTATFWFFYMTWLSVLLLLTPDSALYCVYMGVIVTVVMMVNVWAYTRNSIYEKSLFAMLDKTRIELTLGSGKAKKASGEEAGDESEEEGGSNG